MSKMDKIRGQCRCDRCINALKSENNSYYCQLLPSEVVIPMFAHCGCDSGHWFVTYQLGDYSSITVQSIHDIVNMAIQGYVIVHIAPREEWEARLEGRKGND